MDTKHTPGPWAALPEEVDKPYIRIRGTVLGGRHKIANVLTPVYDGAHPREVEETRANASLISAAPDLLEALRDMTRELVLSDVDLSYIESHFRPWLTKAYAAVARAEGAQP